MIKLLFECNDIVMSHGYSSRININHQDIDGKTALHYASLYGYMDIVEYLINKGADPNIKDFIFGKTPSYFAFLGCKYNVMEYLIPIETNFVRINL